jgi:hypothetical protein
VPRLLRATIVAAACALVLAGCGGHKPSRPRPAGVSGDPVPAESLDQALDRVKGAVTASDCAAVKGLLHPAYGDISNPACAAVKAEIDGFRDPRAKRYGTGAVIDYRTFGGGHRLMALALGPDRTFRLLFVLDVPQTSTSTAKPPGFDRDARAVVGAMQTGDCDAFLRLADRSMGLGVGPDEEVCRRVSEVPFRRELVDDRAARPVPLGGNGFVAFYKLRTAPETYYTMVMDRPQQGPVRGPRYVLVNAFAAQ